MFQNNVNQVTLQNMIIFIEVVENRSFARAAEKLNLSESAISKSLSRLSRKLDILLFYSTGKRWELTPEGKRLYHNWKEHITSIQECYDRIWHETHSVSELKIGISNFIRLKNIYAAAKEEFIKSEPNINIALNSESATLILDHLLSYQYDFVMVPAFTIDFVIKNESLAWDWLSQSNLYVLLPNNHPAIESVNLTLEDLQQETFINQKPFSYSNLIKEKNNIPLTLSSPMTPETFRMSYSDYNYLSLVDDFIDISAFEGAKKCKLHSSPALKGVQAGIIIVWRKDSISPPHKLMIRLLKKYAKR